MSRKYLITVMCIILVVTAAGAHLFAQEQTAVWEGTASMSRYGEFPVSGFYAASNSFPRNTLISVENLQNGKKTTVIVSDRLNNPGLFLLLSQDAAGALGISQDETVRIRVTRAEDTGDVVKFAAHDAPYNRDPDINPAAGVDEEAYTRGMETAELEDPEVSEPEPEEVTEIETAPAAESAPRAEPGYQSVAEEEPPEDEVPVVIDGTPESPEEKGIDSREPVEPEIAADEFREDESPELTNGTPVSPAREPVEVAALAEPVEPEAEEAEETPDLGPGVPRSPEVPPVAADDLMEPKVPEDAAADEESPELAEVSVPSEEEEELSLGYMDEPEEPATRAEEETPEVAAVEPDVPPEIPEDAELVLEPAEPRPPEERAAAVESEDIEPEVIEPEEPKVARADVPESIPETATDTTPASVPLERGAYYLQLGVFSEQENARTMANSFSAAYPVSIYKDTSREKTLYKVLLGPLNQDETGSALYTARAKGYKDAFLRKNE